MHFPAEKLHANRATAFGDVELDHQGRTILYPWNNAAPISLWAESQDPDFQEDVPVGSDDAIFWTSSSSLSQRIRVWTPTDGTRRLLSDGDGTTNGFADLGTDGRDLVWLRGLGRTDPWGPYASLAIYTAPYTTNPSSVVPRRLRSEVGSTGARPFVVGCGYALRNTDNDIRLVRLSDGTSWSFPRGGNPGSLQWSDGVGVTCNEVILVAYVPATKADTVARLPIDSLGPGIPAD